MALLAFILGDHISAVTLDSPVSPEFWGDVNSAHSSLLALSKVDFEFIQPVIIVWLEVMITVIFILEVKLNIFIHTLKFFFIQIHSVIPTPWKWGIILWCVLSVWDKLIHSSHSAGALRSTLTCGCDSQGFLWRSPLSWSRVHLEHCHSAASVQLGAEPLVGLVVPVPRVPAFCFRCIATPPWRCCMWETGRGLQITADH